LATPDLAPKPPPPGAIPYMTVTVAVPLMLLTVLAWKV
jgi:hypothetical protein